MCLIALAYGVSDKYKLVIAANRAEFLDREAVPAYKWEGTDLIAGKDVKGGGTWLGITESGKFAAITNYRDLINKKEFSTSRGSLATGFLLNNYSPAEYLEILKHDPDKYDGYNLIWGTPSDLYYYSNKEGDGIRMQKGIYLLSNHLLNTPWFKSVKFREGFTEILKNDGNLKERLLDLLIDEEKAPNEMLPSTGLPPRLEKEISSIFIRMDNYGTRCSTVLTIDYQNNVEFTEISHSPQTGKKEFRLTL